MGQHGMRIIGGKSIPNIIDMIGALRIKDFAGRRRRHTGRRERALCSLHSRDKILLFHFMEITRDGAQTIFWKMVRRWLGLRRGHNLFQSAVCSDHEAFDVIPNVN